MISKWKMIDEMKCFSGTRWMILASDQNTWRQEGGLYPGVDNKTAEY